MLCPLSYRRVRPALGSRPGNRHLKEPDEGAYLTIGVRPAIGASDHASEIEPAPRATPSRRPPAAVGMEIPFAQQFETLRAVASKARKVGTLCGPGGRLLRAR